MGEISNYEGPKRRQHDLITDLLTDRIDAVARIADAANTDTMSRIDAHISECAANQRWIMRGLLGLCAWVVVHSPEGLAVISKVIGETMK